MGKIKVAIIGVGNCASSLVQGVEYYKKVEKDVYIPGLMHTNIGGYYVKDIEFVAAFDVDKSKVGKDLSKAIFSPPNNTKKFSEVPKLNVKVRKGIVLDSIGKYLKEVVEEASGKTENITEILKESKAEVVINFIPVGSEKATKWYAEKILEADCGMINAIPVFIASNKEWQKKFKDKGLPLIGDDIKSQLGATILHRTLVNLFMDRGMIIDRTYQINFGGNLDFLNMLERERLTSKKKSKTNAVLSQFKARKIKFDEENLHISPSDYIPWLKDNKICYLRIEGRHFGDVPMTLECKLSVEDSPNSAGIVIDAIRILKLALDNGIAGVLEGPSAYLMKSPPVQYDDQEARKLTEEFINKYSKKSS
ncbi:MAG: inositol-3-phosphate synthase [Acidobacteriota bacterium]